AGRVCHRGGNDRDDRRGLLQGDDLRGSGGDDDIDLEPRELPRDLAGAIAASLHPARLDRDGVALDPAKLMQPLLESGNPLALRRGRSRAKIPDRRQLPRLLRVRRKRPRRCCAAKQHDELAPLHSITSSAIASSDGGTVMPSILAVSALMTSSNFDDCTTGRSAGFAPLRT